MKCDKERRVKRRKVKIIDETLASAQVTVNCHREFTDALAAALGAWLQHRKSDELKKPHEVFFFLLTFKPAGE